MTKRQKSNRQVPLDQLISKQEKYMSNLLKEYNYDASEDFLQNQLNKARQQQIRQRNQSMIQSKVQQRGISETKLPRIYSTKKRKTNKSRNSDYEILRAQIESKISKAYGNGNVIINGKQIKQFQLHKSRQTTRKKSPKKTKQTSDKKSQNHDIESSQFSSPKTPIENMKKIEQSSISDDSNEDQIDNIPLKTYHKNLNESLYSQIKQQMGYLLYNRNESLKDWTENLLMMFQRHDKELLTLRFKASYLKKFDPAYFEEEADFQD